MTSEEWQRYKELLEKAHSFYIDLGGILVEVDRQTAEEYIRRKLKGDSSSEGEEE